MTGFKRKKLNMAVKKELQRWLLVRIFGVVLLSSLVSALILYFYANQELGDSFYDAHITIRRVSDLLWPVVAAGSLVSLLSGMLLAVFLPQKVAGPIYRIEKELERLGEGDLTVEIRLRPADPFQDLVGGINQSVAGLRSHIRIIQDICNELEKEGGGLDDLKKLACSELKFFKT
ncbi:MAG: methyl-accepting chemotaxis protein [Proteobacteria bacterium]|nr:methyl-accepting chemotaxis protein [Pseudomonadota bacterium]MBU1545703.1 methyl-accepting chemotaxis protein [Pseudomonadota bacterium]MBU2620397.1 methyl-accepting chemotaxis protein [Pseudomonadota bacterium]